ncbi:MAG: hypothetical protein ABR955_12625 [Verrucomicrobiota bacterium]
MDEIFKIAYLTIENGQQTLKIGKMIFKNGVPLIIKRDLGNGRKVCFPIPAAARHRLQKATIKGIDYHFPDILLPPPENPEEHPNSGN